MPDVPAALRRRRLAVACSLAAAIALIAGGLAGCDPDEPTPPPTTPPASSPTTAASTPTPTPSPAPSATSQREKEEAAVKQAIVDYYATYNQVRMDPDADANALQKVAAAELLETELGAVKEWRAKGWRSTKAVKVENLAVESIAGQGKRAMADYCVNSSGVDVVDRKGESHVVEGRPDFFPTITRLEKRGGTWIPVRERDGGNACDS